MFWGLAAMTAAELQFAESTVGEGYSWLALAQGVFNTQIARWDTTKCDGGMRWQIWNWESGYKMKNSISNGGLFQLSARLYRYTGSETYGKWARKIWDWSVSSPLLSNSTWNVADSTDMWNDCATQGNTQWSYNYGTFLMGATYMYNYVSGIILLLLSCLILSTTPPLLCPPALPVQTTNPIAHPRQMEPSKPRGKQPLVVY
jgi:Glycosyl hydrolase family 76.